MTDDLSPKRRKTTVYLARDRPPHEVIPSPLEDAALALQGYLAAIPSEWRSSAVIDIEAYIGSYDSAPDINVSVYYSRPETDAELIARLEREHRISSQITQAERAQYERLKAKFDKESGS